MGVLLTHRRVRCPSTVKKRRDGHHACCLASSAAHFAVVCDHLAALSSKRWQQQLPNRGSKNHETDHVQDDGCPKNSPEPRLGGLMAKQLLGRQCPWPTTRQRQCVQRAFTCSPGPAACGELVRGVSDERHRTRGEIQGRDPERQLPDCCKNNIEGEKKRYQKQLAGTRLIMTVAVPVRAWSTNRAELDVSCPLAFRPLFDLESDRLIQLRTTMPARPDGDVDENRLASVTGLDTAEAAFVVPGCERAFKAHEK